MTHSTWKIIGGTVAWGLALFMTLSIAQWPGDWGHGVCGPWGCGPPLQAILACHLSWLVALLPAAYLSQYWLTVRQQWLVGRIITAISLAGVAVIGIYELVTWWPIAADWQRRYVLHRLVFAVITQIDLPLLEMLLAGVCLRIQARPHRVASPTKSPA